MITDLKHLRFSSTKAGTLSWPAVRSLPTYSGPPPLRNTAGSSFRLLAKTAYIYQATNKKMQNEPNLQNAQMNLSYVKRKDYKNNWPSGSRKNEPNTNPIPRGWQ